MKRLFYLAFLFPLISVAQAPSQPDAATIRLRLRKLNFLGSVLYVAAHPDDENTRAITYLANDRLAATAYLSMTRGDGGQNLIGPEIRDRLGLIRTQELLAARRIDGGQQFFTRANDFGFSKSADETMKIWGREAILSDVVKVYRLYQPDVIITRFPPDERAGHGHHTASAMLAQEAFDVAADRSRFPEQVSTFGTWSPVRLYTNTGRWWNTTINESTPGVITINVGGYSALLGESFSEIAARSRSQHKSQGFGSRGTRGDQPEYFEYVKGAKSTSDLFEGINTTWTRLKGGEKVKVLTEKAVHDFKEENPAASVPLLMQIRKEILALESSVWKDRKLKEVNGLIADCLGLFCEASATQYYAAPGEHVTANVELVNRSATPLIMQSISIAATGFDSTLHTELKNNVPLVFKSRQTLGANNSYSDPYWLKEPHSIGLFSVANPALIGKPENDPAVMVKMMFSIGGEPFDLNVPLVYRWTDPVKGEQYRPFEIVPPVQVNLSAGVLLFTSAQPQQVKIIVRSASENKLSGTVQPQLPNGWKCEPASIAFELDKREEETVKTFTIYPAAQTSESTIRVVATVNGKQYAQSLETISYDHIPAQTLLPPAAVHAVRSDIKKEGAMIGYIKGAGDDVPAALRSIGYDVWEMKNDEVTSDNLKRLDAVVVGIRALNTNERIAYLMHDLLDYVKNGGTLVMQYNTNAGLETGNFAPYPLSLSRNRVTEEDARVRILAPDHPVLNFPNKIEPEDFNNWVQERGLYFPDKWDTTYTPILSMNDTGEKPMDGSLLVAKYGAGYYVYTGLSFFRELPEGVPGAYKLFVNMVSLSKADQPVADKKKSRSKKR